MIVDNIDRVKGPLVIISGLPTAFHAELLKEISSSDKLKRFFEFFAFSSTGGILSHFF